MARPSPIPKAVFADRAVPGAEFEVRVTPGASRAALEAVGEGFAVRVTEAPVGGKATEAAARLLARALGVAPGRLVLVRGAASRDKRFRLE